MAALNIEVPSLWSPTDLRLCNIKIIDTELPALLSRSDIGHANDVHSETHSGDCQHYSSRSDPRLSHTFYKRLRGIVTYTPEDDDAEVIDSTVRLLARLGFSQAPPSSRRDGQPLRVTRRQYDLPLFMCGSTVRTVADICIVNPSNDDPADDTIVLLVKAAPSYPSSSPQTPVSPTWSYPSTNSPLAKCAIDPATYAAAEAQLISQAIAAFQQHNRQLRRRRLPPLNRKVYPAILMAGSSSFPVLYKIEVTAHLVECVQSGQFPTKVTKVYRSAVGQRTAERVMEELEAFKAAL